MDGGARGGLQVTESAEVASWHHHRNAGFIRQRGEAVARGTFPQAFKQAPATRSIWPSWISGNIGREIIFYTSASVTGKLPGLWPRSSNAGCKCTGIG